MDPPSSPLPAPRANTRKRTRPTFFADQNTPSDPALFSSDSPDPSAEHYFTPRKKKVHRGTWWQTSKENVHHARAGFTRNMDSGVWMGSDASAEGLGSDDTVPDELEVQEHFAPRKPVAMEPRNVVLAKKRINWFAEGGNLDEAVRNIDSISDSDIRDWIVNRADGESGRLLDLEDLNLMQVTDDMLTSLSTIVRPSYRNIFNDEDYQGMDFEYYLSLQRNALSRLPREIFGLRRLMLLNLSHNNFASIPAGIASMEHLCTLNLDGNRLRWLPGELLDRIENPTRKFPWMHFFLVSVSKNPLLQPCAYPGLLALIRSAQGDLDHSIVWRKPHSLAEARARMDSYCLEAKMQSQNQKLCSEQRRWLVRLCEHYLSIPELIWGGNSRQRTSSMLPAAEQTEIVQRWGKTGVSVENLQPESYQVIYEKMCDQTRVALSRHTFLMAATRPCYLDLAGYAAIIGAARASEVAMDESILKANMIAVPKFDALGPQPPDSRPQSLVLKSVLSPNCQLLPARETRATGSRVPSLFSLSLKAATQVAEVPQLRSLLPEDIPETVHRALEAATTAREEGVKECVICGKVYIIPRAEWIEYRFIPDMWDSPWPECTLEELFIPFLRRVCSWGCVPEFDFEED